VLALSVSLPLVAQKTQENLTEIPTSVQTTALLDAGGPQQREAIQSIFLIACPVTQSAGTGFLLDTGVIVTNAHVVKGCSSVNAYALATDNHRVQFRKVISDEARDLALLIPATPQGNGLKLSTDRDPLPGTVVSTWGYPFLFNGTTPLLSVGYVSGYRMDQSHARVTKHLILNAAINHGNSGGPLLLSQQNSVIGVVVATYVFFPPYVRQMLDELEKAGGAWYWGIRLARPDGTQQFIGGSQWQVMGLLFDQFYDKTQTMIGEAISASEIVAMIKEHKQELDAK